MLHKKEIEQIRRNAIVHKEVFEMARKYLIAWENAGTIDKLAGEICKAHNVDSAFRWFHGFPSCRGSRSSKRRYSFQRLRSRNLWFLSKR